MSREVIEMNRGRPPACPYCGSSSIGKGVRKTKTMGIRRIRQCKACRRKFTPKKQAPVPVQSADSQTSAEQAEGHEACSNQ